MALRPWMTAAWLGLSMAIVPATTVCAAVAPPPVPAATQAVPLATPQFRRYGVADGLPSSSVYAVVQDHDGALWFGTKGGIARFDGVHFKVFRHVANDPGSLHDNGIAALMVDSGNRLWAVGLNAGLNRYDAASGKFIHWGHDPGDPASLSSDRAWVVAQTKDGAIWVGTGHGLDRLLPGERGFAHVDCPAPTGKPAPCGEVAALYADARGQLWIGSATGVFRRDAQGVMHPVRAADPGLPLSAWSISGDGDEVRIATIHDLLMVGPDDVARRFGGTAIPTTNVMDSVRDREGRLWIGTQRGLFMQARNDAAVVAITNQPLLAGNLPGTWVWQMLVDRAGGLWLALFDGGVAYLAPGWGGFSRFTHVPDDPASLRDAIVTTMARGHDGRHVWVGERAGRVDRLDPVTGQVEHSFSGLGGDVAGMTQDSRGRLWVIVQGGIDVCDTTRHRCEAVRPGNSGMEIPLEVETGPDGQMYARSFGEGIFRIDPDTLAVSPVPMQMANDKVRWGSQMTLRDGVFWYASDGGMLWLDGGHRRFAMVPGVPEGKSVDAFAFTAHGVWMGNADGLMHYRIEAGRVVRDRVVGVAQGWPSASVVDLNVDRRGRVWVFGHDGLWRYDPDDGSFRSFGLQDGLANSEFSRGYAAMPNGYIYAPSLGGVVAFDPNRIHARRSAPPLAITGIDVRRGGVRQSLPAIGGLVRVGWRDRQLGIQARVYSYLDPAANRYRFFLHGFDNNWVDVGSAGERDLSGLGSGDYTLDLMAAGADGAWVRLPQPLRIHVQAPPWRRWWAWLLYALWLFAALGVSLWTWRRRLAQRHRIELSEQRRQLAEQASAAKTQFLATLSHEIRTPMTGVMGMAELLLHTPLDARQQDYTRAMQRSGGMLLKLLNDALDLVRIDAGKLALEPAPYDPRQLAQDVAQLEQGVAWSKGLRFELALGELPAQVVGDAVRIKQVLLNLVGNALKFTERGSVTLGAKREGDWLVFDVVDTGPGIPEGSQLRLFQRFEQEDSPQRRVGSGLGLAICRELVEMMGGHVELQSQLGAGSHFQVRLPLVEAAPAAPAPAAVPAEDRRLRLLLVEDDAIVARVITGLLREQGHTTEHVDNGLLALAELDRGDYDALLLDLDLPGLDGFQIARLIRQREAGAHLPIVAVTARTGEGDEARAHAVGMDGFLRKPVSGGELAAMLARVRQTATA